MSSGDRQRLRAEGRALNPQAGPEGSEDLDAARNAGQEFLRAGQDAIRRALSGNSQAFLDANRQQGGQ